MQRNSFVHDHMLTIKRPISQTDMKLCTSQYWYHGNIDILWLYTYLPTSSVIPDILNSGYCLQINKANGNTTTKPELTCNLLKFTSENEFSAITFIVLAGEKIS